MVAIYWLICNKLVTQESTSTAIAVASPPPIQRLATPRFLPYFLRAEIRVTSILDPEAPTGCPRAHAPPWILTFYTGSSRSFIADIGTVANASLISKRSTSFVFHPISSNNFFIAPMGAVVNQSGDWAKLL